MPIYEYKCEKCGRRFEFLQKFNEEPKTVCPCGDGGKLKRVISAPAIRFKGSGWYVTDYAKKSSGPAASAPKSEKPEKKKESTKSTSPEE